MKSLLSVSVRNPDITPDMLISRALDDPGCIVQISFRGDDRIFGALQDDTHMVMLPVFKDPVVDDDVAGFRIEALFSRVIRYSGIALRIFFPGDTAGQMAGLAFVRPDGDLKSRFPAAIIDKRRAP